MRFTIKALPPSKALRVMTRIAKVMGEPLSKLDGGSSMDKSVDEILPSMVGALLMNLDEDMVTATVNELLSTVRYNTGSGIMPLNVDLHLTKKMGTMMKLVLE